MKVKRVLPIALALSLVGAATVFAGSLWGDFEGYSKIKLLVNGQEATYADSEVPAFLVDGSAVLPARALSDSLNSMVKWDSANMTLNVYHPDVHMFVARDVGSDYSVKQAFGKVTKGDKVNFVVFAQVDSLKTSISSFKISIETPSGLQATEPHFETMSEAKDSFWFPWPFSVQFDEAGSYKVKFSMKLDDNSDYTVVSEKTIVSE